MKVNEINSPADLPTNKRLSFLLKDSVLYGGAAAFSQAFSLITFPVLTRYFSVSDYGIFDLFTVVAGLLSTIIVFGQDSAIARFFYDHDDLKSRSDMISQSLVLHLIFLMLILPLLWLFAFFFARQISNSSSSETLLKLILLRVPFLVLINFSQNLLKWTFQRVRFLIISIGSTIATVIVIIVAIFFFKISLEGIFVISLFITAAFGLLGLVFVRKWLSLPHNLKYISRLLNFAIPLGIICVAGAFVPTLERSLVNSLLGGFELGLYAVATKLAMIVMLFVQAFQTAWGPFSLSIYKQNDSIHTYNLVLKLFAVITCIIVLLLSAVSHPLILLLASDRYTGAAVLVFPLSMGLLIKAISWITEIGISFSRKSYLNYYSYFAYVFFTLVGIYALESSLGLLGVAAGVLGGHAAKAIVATFLAQKAYPMEWRFREVAVLIVLTMIIGTAGLIISKYLSTFYVSLFFACTIIIVIIFSWIMLFNQQERKELSGIINVVINKYGMGYSDTR